MAKTLQLVFQTTVGKRVTISVDEPIENLTGELVQQAAAEVIEASIFAVEGEPLQELMSAKVIDRQVTDIFSNS